MPTIEITVTTAVGETFVLLAEIGTSVAQIREQISHQRGIQEDSVLLFLKNTAEQTAPLDDSTFVDSEVELLMMVEELFQEIGVYTVVFVNCRDTAIVGVYREIAKAEKARQEWAKFYGWREIDDGAFCDGIFARDHDEQQCQLKTYHSSLKVSANTLSASLNVLCTAWIPGLRTSAFNCLISCFIFGLISSTLRPGH